MGIVIFFGICLVCFIGAIAIVLYKDFRNEAKQFKALCDISEHNKTLRDKEEFDELARWEQARRNAQQKVYPHKNFNQNEYTQRTPRKKATEYNSVSTPIEIRSSSSDLNFGSSFYDSSSWADSSCSDSGCGDSSCSDSGCSCD